MQPFTYDCYLLNSASLMPNNFKSKQWEVELLWIRGYNRISGNYVADDLAMLRVGLPLMEPKQPMAISSIHINLSFQTWEEKNNNKA